MPPVFAARAGQRPWRSRHQDLAGQQPRSDVAAGAAVVVLLAQLLVAQLTLALVICLLAGGRLGRWRPLWLTVPAAAGLALMLHAGVGVAAAGYTAVGRMLSMRLTAQGPVVHRLAGLPAVLGAWPHWLPGQLPVALVAASAEAAVVLLAGRGRRSVEAAYRPGAVVAVRRAYLTAALRRGEVATADGGCVGVQRRTGSRAAISWREAQDGVLCTGQAGPDVTATGLELARAAIAHRKAVIIVDLAPDGLATLIASACADAHAPLRRIDGARGHYEPFASLDPGRGAELVSALVDWTGIAQARQQFCSDYLRAALAAIGATADDRSVPVLDDLIRLLQPGELPARLRELPGGSPVPDILARGAGDLLGQLDSDPSAVAPVAAQLARLLGTPLGGRLCPPRAVTRMAAPAGLTAPSLPAPQAPVRLGDALTRREVVLLSLDRQAHGRPAVMIARLAIADLTGVLTERSQIGVRGDCLVWINGCEVAGPRQLADLVALGSTTGTAMLLTTTAQAAAVSIASLVNVVAVRGPGGPAFVARQDAPDRGAGAGQAASAEVPGSAGRVSLPSEPGHQLPERLLLTQRARDLSFSVRSPTPRVVTGCRAVR